MCTVDSNTDGTVTGDLEAQLRPQAVLNQDKLICLAKARVRHRYLSNLSGNLHRQRTMMGTVTRE